MFVENIQAYGSTDLTELASLITKYINSGDITLITRVETFQTTAADDSIRFYNGDKKILEFTNMSGTATFKMEVFGSPTESWSSSSSSGTGSTRFIYRMIVCKHGVMFKTSSQSGSTSQKGCIFLTETKSGETGVFLRSNSNAGVWKGFFVAWGDQNPFGTIDLTAQAHQSFTGLMAIPTQSATGNHSVNTYYLPQSQFTTYDGLIQLNNEAFYTDGSIAIKDE